MKSNYTLKLAIKSLTATVIGVVKNQCKFLEGKEGNWLAPRNGECGQCSVNWGITVNVYIRSYKSHCIYTVFSYCSKSQIWSPILEAKVLFIIRSLPKHNLRNFDKFSKPFIKLILVIFHIHQLLVWSWKCHNILTSLFV